MMVSVCWGGSIWCWRWQWLHSNAFKTPRLVEESVEINTPASVEVNLPSPHIVDEVEEDWCMAEVNPRVPTYVAEIVWTSGEL